HAPPLHLPDGFGVGCFFFLKETGVLIYKSCYSKTPPNLNTPPMVNLNVFSQILSLIDRELFKDLVAKHKSD
ncbi:hypothetical protein, partial [Sphingobacterium multivorum]